MRSRGVTPLLGIPQDSLRFAQAPLLEPLHPVLPSFTPWGATRCESAVADSSVLAEPTHVGNAFTPFLWGEGLTFVARRSRLANL